MELDFSTKKQIRIKLFRNVKNLKELKAKLISGELKCCMIKPTLIYDPLQIVAAANKALTAQKLTTRTVFTEILFNLSISKNISTSLQTFGVNFEKDENMIVVTIDDIVANCSESVYDQIDGEEIELSELNTFTDVDEIRKVYKIKEKEIIAIPLLDSIVSRIATKDFLSH